MQILFDGRAVVPDMAQEAIEGCGPESSCWGPVALLSHQSWLLHPVLGGANIFYQGWQEGGSSIPGVLPTNLFGLAQCWDSQRCHDILC